MRAFIFLNAAKGAELVLVDVAALQYCPIQMQIIMCNKDINSLSKYLVCISQQSACCKLNEISAIQP